MTDSAVTHQLREDLPIDQMLALKAAATRLHGEFDGTFDTEIFERFLTSSYGQFAPRAIISNFLPALAERFARSEVTVYVPDGTDVNDGPNVRCICWGLLETSRSM
jgi:arsenate reductase